MPLLPIPNNDLCPLKAMLRMFKLVPGGPDTPLFAYQHGKPITYPVYLKFLKEKIQQVGLNSMNYSTHSFRRVTVH